MFRLKDVGCYIDNSAGIYSEAEVIGRLVSLLRDHDSNAASLFCINWIQEIVAILSTSPTAKDDILESLSYDINKLTDLLNTCCRPEVAFEWIDNSLCLVAIEIEEE